MQRHEPLADAAIADLRALWRPAARRIAAVLSHYGDRPLTTAITNTLRDTMANVAVAYAGDGLNSPAGRVLMVHLRATAWAVASDIIIQTLAAVRRRPGGAAVLARFTETPAHDTRIRPLKPLPTEWQDPHGRILGERVSELPGRMLQSFDRLLREARRKDLTTVQLAVQLGEWFSDAGRPAGEPGGRWGLFPAMRLARHEVQRVYASAAIETARLAPLRIGLAWRLAAEHTEPDGCDSVAAIDIGYGPGVYQASELPPYPPHHGCRCDLEAVVIDGDRGLDDAILLASVNALPLLTEWTPDNLTKTVMGES